MTGLRTVALAGATAVAVAVPAASAAAPARTLPISDHYTALAVSVLAEPHPVAGADGRIHLAYEILLVNVVPLTSTVQRIEVLDGERRIADLTGAGLDAALQSITQVPGRTIPGGTVHKATLDVSLPATARPPRTLTHRLTVTTDPPLPELAGSFVAGRTTVSSRPPVVLGPPVTGPRWVGNTGCCDAAGHRLTLQTLNGSMWLGQRFAVDTTQLSADHRLFTGPPDQVNSFSGYGVPVLNGAAGRVVTAVDRFDDNVPFVEPNLTDPQTIYGNHVVVDIGEGRFTLYAHLQPGSVRVRAGQRVRLGQQLGRLGNSGNSSAPHLHFQVMDGPSPIASDGLPFVIASFDSEGMVPPLDSIDITRPIPVSPELSGHHENVSPMVRQVVAYPVA